MKTAAAIKSSLAEGEDNAADADDGSGEARIKTPFLVKKTRPRRKSMPAPKLMDEQKNKIGNELVFGYKQFLEPYSYNTTRMDFAIDKSPSRTMMIFESEIAGMH